MRGMLPVLYMFFKLPKLFNFHIFRLAAEKGLVQGSVREKRERAGRPPKFERVADGSQQRVSQRASLATSESVQYQVSLSGLKRETMRSAILALAFAALIATAGVVTRGTFRAE